MQEMSRIVVVRGIGDERSYKCTHLKLISDRKKLSNTSIYWYPSIAKINPADTLMTINRNKCIQYIGHKDRE